MIFDPTTLAALSPLANHLWQSTLCVCAIGLLTVFLRNNRAAVRYALWLAASLKFLLPFSVLVALGSHFAWIWIKTSATSLPSTQPQWSFVFENISQPFSVPMATAQVSAPHPAISLTQILLALWLGGFAISLARAFSWWRRMHAMRKRATRLPLALPIPVMSSPTLLEPGVFGIWRPVLFLPAGITDRLSPAQLQTVLAHEMCHVCRRDNLTAAIHMLIESLFWFYPVLWLIRTRLIEERERACDEAVLNSGADAESYAESILRVCKLYVESPLVCVSGISGADLKKRVLRIMTQRLAEKLSSGRKILLAVVGMLAVAAPLFYGVMNASQLSAQTAPQPSVEPLPSFEVASIKLDRSGNAFMLMQCPATSDECKFVGATTKHLIATAYDTRDFQISGGPSWINSEKWDIAAKVPPSLVDERKKLGSGEAEEQNRLMLQSLLADRFGLKVTRETKELPVYALVVAKNGPKIHPAKSGDTYPNGAKDAMGHLGAGMMFTRPTDKGQFESIGQGVPLTHLLKMLSNWVGRPIVDRTGLTGDYDFTLTWTPEEMPPVPGANGPRPSPAPPPPDLSGPSIFTALQEQLGLKLESQKGPVEVLVIDHIERPSEN